MATILSIAVPLLLIDNNTVYCSSKFCGGDNLRAIQPSDLGWYLGGYPTTTPPILASTSLCSGCQFWFLCWFQFFVIFDGGYEATPLWVARVLLHVGGSIPCHQGGRCMLIPPPDTEGYLLHFTPISLFGLANHVTQFDEWSYLSWGSLSASINGHWCHSLCCTYVFLLMSTGHITLPRVFTNPCWMLQWMFHGRNHNFLLIHPQGSLAGRSLGDHALPLFSCDASSLFHLLMEVDMHGVGLVHLSHAW